MVSLKKILVMFMLFAGMNSILAQSQLFSQGQAASIKERHEKDSEGREWILKDWEGIRSYPKDLMEREEWYRKKWGENWYGPKSGQRIYAPGNWKWEVVTTVPENMASRIKGSKGKFYEWGNRFDIRIFLWAPGGDDQVADIYVLSDNCFFHYDPITKKSNFIGNPDKEGLKDGVMEQAQLDSKKLNATFDSITGRLYFIQDNKWRYVEKLLPYECSVNKGICYLPAVLDWNEIYRKVESPRGGKLQPAIKDGKRGDPVFVVRTNHALKTLHLPGAKIGKRPLITPDGKGVYFSIKGSSEQLSDTFTLYETTALFDIESGEMINKLKITDDVPRNNWNGTHRWTSDGPGSHGGNNLGYDGKIYTCQHGGAGGGPGRMFSIDPVKGKVTMLYDSMAEDGSWAKRKSPVIDGPADAKSLDFTSTLWQVQCPRTGAIINGGWDNTGIRRYHDGFVTTIAGHNYGAFHKPARPDWSMEFTNVHRNSNPSVAPNGDLYIADVHYEKPRIFRIYRTDWPSEQPVNDYAEKFMPREKVEAMRLEYATKYIEKYSEKNELLKEYELSNQEHTSKK